jgi:hypothetical protein
LLNTADDWHQPESRFESVIRLLDGLVTAGALDEVTASFLKGRAEELDAR